MPNSFTGVPLNPVHQQAQPLISQAMSYYDAEFQEQWRAATASAIGPFDWSSLVVRFLATIFDIVVKINGTEFDKKATVVQAALDFWDSTLKQAVASVVGNPFLFNDFVEPYLRKVLAASMGGVYDAMKRIIDQVTNKAQTPSGPVAPPNSWVPY